MLKRAVIREELVAITGDTTTAILLNQMIYWNIRKIKADQSALEDATVRGTKPNLSDGWVYKKAEELKDECMISGVERTINRKMSDLVSSGILEKRRNPIYKWDKTLQYRPDYAKIHSLLGPTGYAIQTIFEKVEDFYDCVMPILNRRGLFFNRQTVETKRQTDASKRHSVASKRPSVGAIPENTADITSEITTEKTCVEDLTVKKPIYGAASGASEPTSKEWRKIRHKLADIFCDTTELPFIESGKPAAAETLWYGPLKAIYRLAGYDIEVARKLIRDAYQKGIEAELTLSTPKSIVKMVVSDVARGKHKTKKKITQGGTRW